MCRVFSIWTATTFVLFSGGNLAATWDASEALRTPISGPLRASRNPNYLRMRSGTPLILCGSQTWNTLQDWGTDGTVRPLDFDAFVGFLKAHGHNFTLLWCTELPKFHGLPSTENSRRISRSARFHGRGRGPGLATDGGLKFDLTEVRPGLFRSIAHSGADPEPRRHLCRRLFVHRRMAAAFSLPDRRLPVFGAEQCQWCR